VEWLYAIVGHHEGDIAWWQLICRAVLVLAYTLVLVRVGGRRIFGKYTSFDIVLGVILGSMMSRTLTGNAALLPTMAAAATLVGIHSLLAIVSRRSPAAARLVKGRPVQIVRGGEVIEGGMKEAKLERRDLEEALRLQGSPDLPNVDVAYVERNGDISVVVRDVGTS